MNKIEMNIIIEKAERLIEEISAMGKEDPKEIFENLCMISGEIIEVRNDMKHIQSMIIKSFEDINIESKYWGEELDTQKQNEINLVKKLKRMI
jgi:hypothetical protein